jgi:hypothetical protein
MHSGYDIGQSAARLECIDTDLAWQLGGLIEYVAYPFPLDPNTFDKYPFTRLRYGLSKPIAIVASTFSAPVIRSGTRFWDL